MFPVRHRRIGCDARAKSKAFTLIEVMIVVGIISLLAAVAISRYYHALDVSDVATAKLQIKQISNAVASYRMDNHAFPLAGGGQTVVTPAIFGGNANGNGYMNGTPSRGPDIYWYWPPATGTSYYQICTNYRYDKSLLTGMVDANGGPLNAGPYLICYNDQYGGFFGA